MSTDSDNQHLENYMEFLVLICFIWIICIQAKLNEISKKVNGNVYQADNQKEIITQEATSCDESVLTEKTENQTEIISKCLNAIEDKKPKNKTENGFEKVMLGNIFNKIGAVAILVGIIIFVKLVSSYIVFTPALKITLSYLASILMCSGAFILNKKENLKNYSEVLLGTGYGTLFIATYCAKILFNLFSMPVTFTIATILLLGAFFLANKLKTVSMLAISLIAGYLNPFFIDNNQNFVIWYLIFINLLSLLYTYKNNSKSCINVINLILTFITALSYCHNVKIMPFAILWGLYFTYDLLCGFKAKNVDNRLLSCINFGIFSIFTITLTNDTNTAIIGFALCLLYSLAFAFKKEDKSAQKVYLSLILTAFNTALYYLTQNHMCARVITLAAESAILCIGVNKFKLKELSIWASGVWIWALSTMFFVNNVIGFEKINEYFPVWNIRLWMFMPVIAAGVTAAHLLKQSEEKSFLTISKMFKVGYISLIYIFACLEINDAMVKYFTSKNIDTEFIKTMVYSILGCVYTINFKTLYNQTKFGFYLFLSAFVGIISILSIVGAGYDYIPIKSYIPILNIRFATFLSGIGVLTFYAKQTKYDIFKYFALLLGFVLLNAETNDFLSKYNLIHCDYLYSVIWVLYAGIITIIGIFKDKKYLKYFGIFICILSVLKIFIYDLSTISAMFKFAAFLILGAVLMVLSYFYNKKQ